MLRKFDSGVMVIQNKSHSDEEVILYFYNLFHVFWILQFVNDKTLPFHLFSRNGEMHVYHENF